MKTFRAKVYRITNALSLENRMDLETLVDLCLNKPTMTITLLQLLQLHQVELKKRTTIDRSKATFAKYRYTEDKLKAFLQFRYQRKDLHVHKLEPSFIQLFYDYLLLECGIHHNTIAKYCKNLKRILNYGKEKGVVKENPFSSFQIGCKDIDRSYLTTFKLFVLERKQMAVERLGHVKDLFLFQYYTELAFADLMQLSREHLLEGVDSKPWIVIRRSKTKAKSTIPLLPPALRILDKYKASQVSSE